MHEQSTNSSMRYHVHLCHGVHQSKEKTTQVKGLVGLPYHIVVLGVSFVCDPRSPSFVFSFVSLWLIASFFSALPSDEIHCAK